MSIYNTNLKKVYLVIKRENRQNKPVFPKNCIIE